MRGTRLPSSSKRLRTSLVCGCCRAKTCYVLPVRVCGRALLVCGRARSLRSDVARRRAIGLVPIANLQIAGDRLAQGQGIRRAAHRRVPRPTMLAPKGQAVGVPVFRPADRPRVRLRPSGSLGVRRGSACCVRGRGCGPRQAACRARDLGPQQHVRRVGSPQAEPKGSGLAHAAGARLLLWLATVGRAS